MLDPEPLKHGNAVSDFYGDSFYDEQSSGSLRSARAVLGGMFQLAPVTTMLDVGCGVGSWLRAALDLGAQKVVGVDGDYVNRERLMIDRGDFRPRDLEEKLELDAGDPAKFDLVTSLEVAEHVPADKAETFVSNLVAHGDLVLFSAAIPRQGGTNHVNEQWPDYWARIFAKAGYDCFDIIRPEIWGDDSIEWWYAQNSFVYARRGSPSHRLVSERGRATALPLALVHPKKLDDAYHWFKIDVDDAVNREQVLLGSTSWRVTKPLRAIGEFVSRFRRTSH
jgi:SAM-dependent methyltransferase